MDRLIQMAVNLVAMMVNLMALMKDPDLVDLKGLLKEYRWADLRECR